jgi:hypothetical protein
MTSHSEVVPLDVGGMLNELAGMPPHLEVRFVDESYHPKRDLYSVTHEATSGEFSYVCLFLQHHPFSFPPIFTSQGQVMHLVWLLNKFPLYKEVFLVRPTNTYMCTPGEATQDAYTFQLHERI